MTSLLETLQWIVLGLGGAFLLAIGEWVGWALLGEIWDDIRHGPLSNH